MASIHIQLLMGDSGHPAHSGHPDTLEAAAKKFENHLELLWEYITAMEEPRLKITIHDYRRGKKIILSGCGDSMDDWVNMYREVSYTLNQTPCLHKLTYLSRCICAQGARETSENEMGEEEMNGEGMGGVA
jgi:hypothetical protein